MVHVSYPVQRFRGFVLTPAGLQKLQEKIAQLEVQTRRRQTPRTIAERVQLACPDGIHPMTVRKILLSQAGVDRRSIQRVFQALCLELQDSDYTHAGFTTPNQFPLEGKQNQSRAASPLLAEVIPLGQAGQLQDSCAAKVQAAVLEERRRMAREIHDTLGQVFISILLRLESARISLAASSPGPQSEAHYHLDMVGELARLGLVEARRVVQGLRPLLLTEGYLGPALSRYLRYMTDYTSIRGVFQQRGEFTLSADVEMEVFRIAQEAITNACKHAQASTLTVELVGSPQVLFLLIQDNGCGFQWPSVDATLGFGLLNMQERAQKLGAQLNINTFVGMGTQILLTLEMGKAQ